jgi:hypothetical protein
MTLPPGGLGWIPQNPIEFAADSPPFRWVGADAPAI